MYIWRSQDALDSGAHFYEVYQTKDGKYLSVGALEPQFYALLLKVLLLPLIYYSSSSSSSSFSIDF